MPGIFKKLSANDIKITPFEAHKQYDSTDLTSIGAQTASLAWSGLNKSTFTAGNKKYYQIDKLYYRNYIQERANRLELDDATYTTQERRLYQSASLLSLSQKTFGSEVQPNSFNLTVSKGSDTYTITDDGFGNLYNTTIGKDNFPNEDYRLIYLGPTQAFKRADLTINYETGNEYVNNPFPNGYTHIVHDDSYFLNKIKFDNVYFVTSSNYGISSIKTPNPYEKVFTTTTSSINLAELYSNGQISGSLGENTSLLSTSGDFGKLFDGISLSTAVAENLAIDDDTSDDVESFTLTFDPPLSTNKITSRVSTYLLSHSLITEINGDESTRQSSPQASPTTSQFHSASFENFGNTLNSITYFLSHSAILNLFHTIQEVELDASIDITEPQPSSSIVIPHQPQFNFEKNDDFTINFYYDLNTTDHINSTITSDYFILTKEGNKTIASLPSEQTSHTPLSDTGSSDLKTLPIGNQFPYRIYYKGNYPNNNTASLFFERSDGDVIQFVSSSFFTSGSTITQKHITCKYDDNDDRLTLRITDTSGTNINYSSTQNSPTLNKTTSNKADITLYNKPNLNGSYSNFIGYGGGQISQLMVWNQALSAAEIKKVSSSIVGTPNIGNIFYDNGFSVLTHPKYMGLFDGGSIDSLSYKNTHLITENEYQCTMTEDEFEFTTNISARKIPFSQNEDIANFATSSNFKPYITSVGLYDDNGNLLVTGKLGQPIKASSETDTTFVVRYDTW